MNQAYPVWLARAGGRKRAPAGLRWALALACGVAAAVAAAPAAPVAASLPAQPLVVLVDTGTEMPMAAFVDDALVDGIHKDLGMALAQKMGRKAQFLILPRKRIERALEAGQADIICMYVPDWLPGRFQWSQPFFPMNEVVVTPTTAPRPRTLADLSGQRIATVLGYFHPEMEQALGAGFVRDDGPSSYANLRKLAVGRMNHALISQITFDYQQKTMSRLSVHPPLVVKTYQAQCAVAEHGHVGLAEVNRAIAQLVKDGGIARIIAAYKPG